MATPHSAEPRCPACGEDLAGAPSFVGRDRVYLGPERFDVFCCPSCGTGVTWPPATPEDLDRFYPSEYPAYLPVGPGIVRLLSTTIRRRQVRRALAHLPFSRLAAMKPGRLVEVGCGRGDIAGGFVSSGWHVVGVEPSAEACTLARAQGVEAREGILGEVPLEAGAYQGAIFRHSLEHSLDPEGDLKGVFEALGPGGVLAVTLPNFASWQRKLFRDRWFPLELPRHRIHYSPEGLRRALERAGFEVESITTATMVIGLPASIQYALFGRYLFRSGLPWRVVSGLYVLILPFARLADWIGGGGDELLAVAVHP